MRNSSILSSRLTRKTTRPKTEYRSAGADKPATLPIATRREQTMSHFSLLVITKEPPTDDVLSRLLQPFHEFECTGEDDEYVQDVDKTEEVLEEYAKHSLNRLKDPSGSLHSPYDDCFYRDPTPEELQKIGTLAGIGSCDDFSYTSKDWGDGLGYRPKVRFIPDGYEEVEVKTYDTMTIAEFIDYWHGEGKVLTEGEPLNLKDGDAHKYGYAIVSADGTLIKFVKRTNPSAKWDWWTVGGRWSGAFLAGYDASKDPRNYETCWLCGGTGKRLDMEVANGCNACGGTGRSQKHPPQWVKTGNTVQAGQLNLKVFQDQAAEEALALYDKAKAIIGDRAMPSWDDLRDQISKGELTHKEARDKYWNDPVIQDLNKERFNGIEYDMDRLTMSREAVEEMARANAIGFFAVLHEGKWYERGEMGWWGIVSNEGDKLEWGKKTTALIESLPPDTWITVVDAHI